MTKRIEPGFIHGSCVRLNDKGILILGPSGSGKSGLVLQLIGLGAKLVGDDQIILDFDHETVVANKPPTIAGLVEARGIGLLKCDFLDGSTVNLVVDMAHSPKKRLPELKTVEIGPHHIDLIDGEGVDNLPSALWLLTLHGRA